MIITNCQEVIIDITPNAIFLTKDNNGLFYKTTIQKAEYVQNAEGTIYEWGRKKGTVGFYDAYSISNPEEIPEKIKPLEYCYNETDGFTKYEGQVTYTADELSVKVNETNTNISGEYKATNVYSKDEYCSYNGNLYRFTQDSGVGILPTNTTYWTLCDIATELNRLSTLIKEK